MSFLGWTFDCKGNVCDGVWENAGTLVNRAAIAAKGMMNKLFTLQSNLIFLI